jgi:hypothetical protein
MRYLTPKRLLVAAGAAALLASVLSVGAFGKDGRAAKQAGVAKGLRHSRASSTTGPPAFVPQVAQRLATIAGDRAPTSSSYVYTRRQDAQSIQGGDKVDTNGPAYLVVMHGHFVYKNARGFGPPPTGSVLTVTIDAATGQSTDLGIGNAAPDLARLGAVHALQLPASAPQ